MNNSWKIVLLAAVLTVGGLCAEAHDGHRRHRGEPDRGVEITRTIVGGVVRILAPRPCYPPPPRATVIVVERTVIVEREHRPHRW